jgi:hypothetical protein
VAGCYGTPHIFLDRVGIIPLNGAGGGEL